jgi:hypothetical protein
LFGNLFREKVFSVQRTASNIIAPRSPERNWSALPDVPILKRSVSAPEDQERTNYPTPARTIRPVMLAIDGRGGSILLTEGVCVTRISKSVHIGDTDCRRER